MIITIYYMFEPWTPADDFLVVGFEKILMMIAENVNGKIISFDYQKGDCMIEVDSFTTAYAIKDFVDHITQARRLLYSSAN